MCLFFPILETFTTRIHRTIFNKKVCDEKETQAAVYLRLTIDGKRTEIFTKTVISKDKWIPGKGRVKEPAKKRGD